VPTYRDEGIVLRTQRLGEADRIVTLLTRAHGRVRAVAKGVRRTGSRFGARLEPFGHVDIQLHEGRSLDTVTQVESLAAHGATLSADYPRWTSGTAMLEAAERLTPVEREPAVQQYLLLIGGLRTLVSGTHDPSLILDAFLVRSLAIAGWSPSFSECARCGAPGPSLSTVAVRSARSAAPRAALGPPPRHSTCSARCSPETGQPPMPASPATAARRADSLRHW
jgi:DNA repair protein RecO (recombination protein O)